MKNNNKFAKAWAKIVERCWEDEVFKQHFIKNPAKVFEEYGMEMPLNTEYKIAEEEDPYKHTVYISLPKKPDGELREEKLKQINGGCCSSIQCSNPPATFG